jgi:hypothetical protein
MAADFEQAAAALMQEIKRLQAEKRALETKVDALRLTEEELTTRIGDHMRNLEVKQRLEELQRAAGKFVAGLEALGI